MRKILSYSFSIMLVFLLVAAGVHAVPTYYNNDQFSIEGSPYYFGHADSFIATIDGNDNPNQDLGDLNTVIDDWNDYFDGDPSSDDDYALPYLVTATGDLGGGIGTVSATLNVSGYSYLTVKYSGVVDLFKVDGLETFGWVSSLRPAGNSGRLQQAAISHYRLWNPTPVPEPTTMILLGTGLIGLAGLRRRFKK